MNSEIKCQKNTIILCLEKFYLIFFKINKYYILLNWKEKNFLHSLTPHNFKLKSGAIIRLRNILIKNALCNGTRLEVVAMDQNCITAVLISRLLKGKHTLIPRLKLALSDPNLPFTLE